MGRAAKQKALSVVVAPTRRLDLGCGPHPREGFEGVDIRPFGGHVLHVVDLTKAPWPWADGPCSTCTPRILWSI